MRGKLPEGDTSDDALDISNEGSDIEEINEQQEKTAQAEVDCATCVVVDFVSYYTNDEDIVFTDSPFLVFLVFSFALQVNKFSLVLQVNKATLIAKISVLTTPHFFINRFNTVDRSSNNPNL